MGLIHARCDLSDALGSCSGWRQARGAAAGRRNVSQLDPSARHSDPCASATGRGACARSCHGTPGRARDLPIDGQPSQTARPTVPLSAAASLDMANVGRESARLLRRPREKPAQRDFYTQCSRSPHPLVRGDSDRPPPAADRMQNKLSGWVHLAVSSTAHICVRARQALHVFLQELARSVSFFLCALTHLLLSSNTLACARDNRHVTQRRRNTHAWRFAC